MKAMKRIAALLLALMLLCGVAACTGRAGTVGTEAAEKTAAPLETAAPVEETAAVETPAAEADSTQESGAGTDDDTAYDESFVLDYKDCLFEDSYVHRVEVTIDPADWEYMRENVLNKPKFQVTVTIDGETYENVKFSPKGSSSLRDTASSTFYHDRYSYKLSFGSISDGNTYHGLDSLSLDNGYEDTSLVRDYLAYHLFRMVGVPAPLVSFTEFYVNGELQGLYYAVENEGASFLTRNGMLPSMTYMPEPAVLTELNSENAAEVGSKTQNTGRFDRGSPITAADVIGTPGADLKYTGDDHALYSDIFENTNIDITEEDETRVIAALKALSEGDPESGVNVDEVICYFAVHNFITSWDSYTGVMLHNYMLAETNGILSMIPWDYNLAFSTKIAVHDADTDIRAGIINMDIDDPSFQDVNSADRPMWYWITQDDAYLLAYHAMLERIILLYFESGEFLEEMEAVKAMIRPYVEQDPTYAFSMEEFDEGYLELETFCLDRAAAVRAQLDAK